MRLGQQHFGVYCTDIDVSRRFYEEALGFRHLFSTVAMEGDKPLKMAWLRNADGVAVELLEQENKDTVAAAGSCLNHIALRVDDMDAAVRRLEEHGVAIEAGPFDAALEFGEYALDAEDASVFSCCGDAGLKVRILFFRGPGNERFELIQDNVGGL